GHTPGLGATSVAADRRQLLALTILALAAVGFVVALDLTPIYSKDFWIQLKVGDLIRTTGSIPRTILFACTEARDFEFHAHEWLPSVLNSFLYTSIGAPGMIVYKCALAMATLGLAVLLSWQINRNPLVSVLVGSLVLLGLNARMDMRPEIYAFALALINLNLIQLFLRRGRWQWLLGLLPTSLAWANTH